MSFSVEMLNITKKFSNVIANDNISIQVKKGEIHALLGENGAGKSTLMSVLFGMYSPDEGIIKIDGSEVKIKGPSHANSLGIGMVHQHFKLVHNLTVVENILLGIEPTKKGLLSFDESTKKIQDLSDKYSLYVDPNAKIEDISVGMQQRVEILKMLYRDTNILIFDEPTAVLTPQEIKELMSIIKKLSDEGKSIIIITHKLNEIKAVADNCTILRKGKYIGTVDVSITSKETMSSMMVGREVTFDIPRKLTGESDIILEVKNLNVVSKTTKKHLVKDVSLKVNAGEILCIAGIEGNGQTELIEAITGLRKLESGTIYFRDKDITSCSTKEKINMGIGHIPEDRHKHGLVLEHSLAENLILHQYNKKEFKKGILLNKEAISNYSIKLIEKFDIRAGKNGDTIVRSMSGGNQQKAIIAREVDKNPDLLIAVQPTRGLDVGAIENIYKQLIDFRDSGKAVLLVSLELDEVLTISDRISVMYEGEIVAEVETESIDENKLGLYMAGSREVSSDK